MKILSITIKDFLSVKSLYYAFDEGLHLFKGNNGAGKTTILQALQVGLFNKTDRPQPWGRINGAGGFIIIVNFTDKDGNDIIVINDRRKNRFEIYDNGLIQTHQISKGLPMVSKMLNLTYHEFSMLSYLTPTTVSSILTGTDSSLISKFFSLHVLKDYDNSLREERKSLSRDRRAIESNLADAASSYKPYDVITLTTELDSVKKRLAYLRSSTVLTDILELEREILETLTATTHTQSIFGSKKLDLDKLLLVTNVCPTCGHNLKDDTTAKLVAINKIKREISDYNIIIQEGFKKTKLLEASLALIKIPYDEEVAVLEDTLSITEGELIAATVLDERDSIDTTKLTKSLTELERKIHSLNIAISAIKSGDVHKSYLQTFTSVLNTNLGNLRETLGIKLRVLAKIDSNGLSFSIMDDGIYKFSDVLSSGEKVIVGLMVLSAMFNTLGDTLDIKISTVMLDEAVSAVSKENMEVVESLLKDLAKDRCVIITQHHEELSEDLFDTINIIQKADGLTEIR